MDIEDFRKVGNVYISNASIEEVWARKTSEGKYDLLVSVKHRDNPLVFGTESSEEEALRAIEEWLDDV